MIRALLLLLLLGACSSYQRTETLDPGGSILFRAAEIAAKDGRKRFEDGFTCNSACTMWLAYDEVCAEPGSSFGFHALKNDITGAAEEIYEAHLRDADLDLLRWYRGAPNNSRTVTWVSGAWLIEQGWVTACG